MDPFWEKIVFSIIDKGLLTVAGAGIAYFTALALERYRRDQAMVLELGKLRAQAFVRLMSMLGEHSALFTLLAGGLERSEENLSAFEALSTRAQQFLVEMHTALPRELVLLDPELRARIWEYADVLYKEINFKTTTEKPLSKAELEAWHEKLTQKREAVMELVPRLPKH